MREAEAAEQQLMGMWKSDEEDEAPQPEQAEQDDEGSEDGSLTVTVPEGVSSGDTITLTTDGGEVDVEVPEGLSAGDEFSVELGTEPDEPEPKPEPEPESESEPEPAMTAEVLPSELEGLRLSAVQKRAVSEGVPPDAVEGAMDSDDPKASLIRLIVESASRRGAGRLAEPEPAAEGDRP